MSIGKGLVLKRGCVFCFQGLTLEISKRTMIPGFTKKGALPSGIHLCTGQEYIDRMCFNQYRKGFEKSICDIFDWAKYKGAQHLFIGGSFNTDTKEPYDIDCLITFQSEKDIPHKSEMLTISSMKFDVLFCAESAREVIDTFLFLFKHSRMQEEVGVVQIDLYDIKDEWKIRHYPDDESYEVIKQAYIGRYFIDHYEPNGILVTVHGLLSNAKWNADIAPIASSQNWVFAPFLYDTNTPDVLINSKKRRQVVNEFRDWIHDIHEKYPYPVSIIAHSFGTYIIGAYISGFEEFLPVQLNTIILTGSILTKEFDWDAFKGCKVARVLNEIAPNDQWVQHMPKVKWFDKDPLYGNSGVVGFSKKSDILKERKSNIFNHNNVIKKDIIDKFWLPFLMANKDAYHFEGAQYFKRKYSKSNKQTDTDSQERRFTLS